MSRASDAERAGIEERLNALFDRAGRFSDAELRLLRLAWNDGDSRERQRLWRKVRSAARLRKRDDLLEGARAYLAEWVNNYLTATTLDYGTLLTARSGMDTSVVRADALAPLLDAAAAIIAFDGLDPAEREFLYEPVARLSRSRRSRSRRVPAVG